MADKRLPHLSPFRSYSRTEESGLAIFRHCTASTVYDTGMIEDNPGDAATCGLLCGLDRPNRNTIPSTLVCQPYLIGILQVRHPICATESDMNFPDRRPTPPIPSGTGP
ncbi:uncharacterized protein CCOS01_04760 [Colletotrichum costaricense]|uniref:Uncharacterized protein n=1 Tax=Colletotrichum costaricense TaxID=1209916 RepID=A0AAI9Z393_9PEZI|nr:uncharacterized protein CCOS01_04760 [Colletotrichum costaricense]KAK1532777.1 hypothetical protein CCOS01_04760 [Colletotrichum costaricense]